MIRCSVPHMSIAFRTALAAAGAALAVLGLTACGGGTASSIVGVWGEPEVPEQTSVEFFAGGTFSGTDGCNQVSGDWSADGDAVEFGPMISTMMFCEGVDTWLTQ